MSKDLSKMHVLQKIKVEKFDGDAYEEVQKVDKSGKPIFEKGKPVKERKMKKPVEVVEKTEEIPFTQLPKDIQDRLIKQNPNLFSDNSKQ